VEQAGTAQAKVGIEPWVLPVGAGVDVGGKPTATADAGADAGEAGRWGHDGTTSGTLEGHYRMELPLPSSSWSRCGHGSHHP
jgi:hypothetical protein